MRKLISQKKKDKETHEKILGQLMSGLVLKGYTCKLPFHNMPFFLIGVFMVG